MTTVLQETCAWALEVNGTDFWDYVEYGSVTVTQSERGEIGTLAARLQDYDGTLDFLANVWDEVYLYDATTGYYLFGGYLISANPEHSKAMDHEAWTLKCESWSTRFNKTATVRKTYVAQTAKAILQDLFTTAGLAGFDTTTYVHTGDTLVSFSTAGEKLTDILDKLASLANNTGGTPFVWWVAPNKDVHFGTPSEFAAPFDIAPLATTDWFQTFPAIKGTLTRQDDSTNIINRVTVRGGTTPSAEVTDTFTGDAVKTLFQLTYRNVWQITSITKAGILQSYGVDWYDVFGGGYDTLVNYAAGTVKFPDAGPPGAAVSVVVKYKYNTAVQVTRDITDIGGTNDYGIWFDKEIEDRAITSEQEAIDVADAVLYEYGVPMTTGQFQIPKLRLEPGQAITITEPLLGLSGDYTIRKVTSDVGKNGYCVFASVTFGGRARKFSGFVNAIPGQAAAGAYGYEQRYAATQKASNDIPRTATAISYTCTASDYIVAVTNTSAPRVITLPAAAAAGRGRQIIVKDEGGLSGTNAITINVTGGGTIDGSASKTLQRDYGVMGFYSDGAQWRVISDTATFATSLTELTDVTIAGPGANQVIQWDTGTSQWVNATLAAGHLPATALLTTGARAGATGELQVFDYGLTVNEGSFDSDTRIESNGEANMVFVDAGADEVWLGGATNGVKVAKGGVVTLEGTATLPGRCRLFAWVAHDAQNSALGALPANSHILAVHCQVLELFDSDGADEITVGYDATPNAYATAIDVSTTGIKTVTLGAEVGFEDTARAVEAYYVNGGTEPTTGKALIILEYAPVSAAPA
jgi:hypothetical protein